MFDHLRIALHFADQGVQACEALADDGLTVLDSQTGMTAGIGGLTRVPGNLLDSRLQFAERIANQRRVSGLMFGAAVQFVAQLGEGATAARDLFSIAANGPDQIHQIRRKG